MILNELHESMEQVPDKIAVVDETGQYSYFQLQQDAGKITAYLIKNGCGRGDRVGIYMESRYLTVVAMLGIMGAGAAYVPIAKSLPRERIQGILADSQTIGVMVDDQYAEGFISPQTYSVETMLRNTEESSKPFTPLEEDIAYVLYTSGSTGTPKGVCIPYRAFGFFVRWSVAEFDLTEKDSVASHSSLSFDMSVFEIFASLTAAAAIFFVPSAIKHWPASFAAFLSVHKITILYAVPSFLTALAGYGNLERQDLSALRLVLFAGEPFWRTQFDKFIRQLPSGVAYANLYGPTETNVCTFYWLYPPYPDELPIGKALPGVNYLILSDNPEVNPGELVIFGPCVMQGYCGDSGLYDESYWYHDHGEIGYKTGDLVTKNKDGLIYLTGRKDSIIKVNGYRVSTNEILKTILKYSAVERAYICLDWNFGLADILAFVCLKDNLLDEHIKRIREVCLIYLPRYMMPRRIIAVSEFPYTDSGKIDGKRLIREWKDKHKVATVGGDEK